MLLKLHLKGSRYFCILETDKGSNIIQRHWSKCQVEFSMRLKEQGAAAIHHIKGIYQECRMKTKIGSNANSDCQLEQLNMWNNALVNPTNLGEWRMSCRVWTLRCPCTNGMSFSRFFGGRADKHPRLEDTILMNTGVDAVLCLLSVVLIPPPLKRWSQRLWNHDVIPLCVSLYKICLHQAHS